MTSARIAGRRRLVVIVVDDSEIARETVREILEDNGFAVVTLDSPFGLSRALQEHRPDLVLIDVQMPALRGDQVVESVANYRLHRCPMVLHSDRPAAELAELVRRSGAAGFIRKSGDAATLLGELRRFVRG